MTGIYLGLEGNSKPPRSKSAIPPLARGRGMSSRIRTPAEDRRYKMVEYLRIKEEKRGFTGGAIRGCKSASAAGPDCSSREQFRDTPTPGLSVTKRRWGPGKRIDPSNVDDLIRPNPRNFTTVANSGVTRSEKLVGWMPMGHDIYSVVPAETVTEEVFEEVQKIANNSDDLAGLEDCYKRICKGNVESLYGLLPNRRANQFNRRDIGFTVRSYRNPGKAEILAEFPDPMNHGRPKTVPIQRPLVPNPYFFQHSGLTTVSPFKHNIHNRQHARAAALGQFDNPPDYIVVPRILAAPGAGGISKTLQYGASPLLTSLQLLNGKQYMSQFADTSRSADDCRDLKPAVHGTPSEKGPGQQHIDSAYTSQEEVVRQPDNSPRPPTADRAEEASVGVPRKHKPEPEPHKDAKDEDDEVEEEKDNVETSETLEQRGEPEDTMTSEVLIAGDVMIGSESHAPRPRLVTSNSGADIMLGLETDEGKTAEVEIDSLESDELQPEEIPKGRVRKTSIVEKLSKSKESELIALTIMETAGQRQREFEQLINEHQELVHEISRTPSAENIVQSEDGRDP